jgi:hypothetical protein
MSKHEPYGNVKMKGKKFLRLPCGCCVARNGRKMSNREKFLLEKKLGLQDGNKAKTDL